MNTLIGLSRSVARDPRHGRPPIGAPALASYNRGDRRQALPPQLKRELRKRTGRAISYHGLHQGLHA